MRGRIVSLLTVATVGIAACGTTEEAPVDGPDVGAMEADSGNFSERVYERNLVFASAVADSAFFVPWVIKTVETPDTILREADGWLARGGAWDGFFSESWGSPPTRAPNRLLPFGGLQLLVQDGDVIDGILFEEGPRSLEVILGESSAVWTGAGGSSFQVLSGVAYLAEQRIDGMVLDMTRTAVDGAHPGGDWAFLLSGDSAQFVFAGDGEHAAEDAPGYRGWGTRAEGPEVRWPSVVVEWSRREAFPPARRDVPVEWQLSSVDGSLEGTLEASSAQMSAGQGPGPLLPVRALYEVSGVLQTDDGPYPVYGLVFHERR